MKKAVTKKVHKESEFEMLARLVKDGFERMDKRFEQVDKRFEQIDKRFNHVDARFELVNSQLFSINHELKEHTVRLDSIERKQGGMRLSLDETVHVSELKALTKRVEKLEKSASK